MTAERSLQVFDLIPFKSLPEDVFPPPDARILKAAVRFNGFACVGWRHSEIIKHLHSLGKGYTTQEDQGFVDQFGNFYNRKHAAGIALYARQISRVPPVLTSEDLWDVNGVPRDPTKPYAPTS